MEWCDGLDFFFFSALGMGLRFDTLEPRFEVFAWLTMSACGSEIELIL